MGYVLTGYSIFQCYDDMYPSLDFEDHKAKKIQIDLISVALWIEKLNWNEKMYAF